MHVNNEKPFRSACELGDIKMVKLLLSLKRDRYVNIHSKDEYAFKWASIYKKNNVVTLLLSLKGDRKINVSNLHFDNETRQFLLKIMMRKIYCERKILSYKTDLHKKKRILLRELKSLPKSHLYHNFPGGSDYLKMLSKY